MDDQAEPVVEREAETEVDASSDSTVAKTEAHHIKPPDNLPGVNN
jgi:hypothetical protein